MAYLKSSLLLPSVLVATCFMALLFCSAWGQDKGVRKDDSLAGQVTPPKEPPVNEDKTPWRAAQTPDVVTKTGGEPMRFNDGQPFPPRGFAKGIIVTLGDDSGDLGTYRMAFRWESNGQDFPLIECRRLQALEDKLFAIGPNARHGGVTVEVKGTVTLYRDMNFLLLTDFRLTDNPVHGSGVPAARGGIRNLP